MSRNKCHLVYALGTLAIGASLLFGAPVGAENSTTIDLSTQPHLKSWSNIIPNSARRFIVLPDFGGEAVLDRETGLVWEKSPSTVPQDWSTARTTCINKSVGGRKGWRLPAIPELASLIDPNVVAGPTLPAGHPFENVHPAFYWSATTNSLTPSNAWVAIFINGVVDENSKTFSSSLLVWCARGGMNTGTY